MNLRLLYTFLISALSTVAYGQKYGNVWHFGDHAAIDFNSCKPIALADGNNSGFEGCAAISDTSGELLFYTNSDTVWDRLGNAMPNGKLLTATLSQVIIVPKLPSLSQFYIVTTDVQAQGTYGLQYHVVDMVVNSGLGDVVSKNNSLSNLLITEQICATYHANGIDIWLMTHEYGTSNFLAFLLSENGISQTPVISNVGPFHAQCISNFNARGQIKFSPDGSKVAFNGNGVGNNLASNLLCVLDFDNSQGVVSNPINLPYSQGEFGLSFSSDNSKLYGATWKAFGFSLIDYNYLYQFDLSSGNESAIINSKVVLDSIVSSGSSVFGDLKLGPDGKIYVTNGSEYLGRINSPNVAGENCDYVHDGVYLGGGPFQYGLNNYIEYRHYCSDDVSVQNSLLVEKRFSVVPNPFSTSADIQFENSKNKPARAILFDIFGREILETSTEKSDVIKLVRGNLKSGIYYIQLLIGNQIIAVEKVIIN